MSDVKRLLILTADVGFGHRAAAKAIAAAVQEVYSDALQVEVFNPLDDRRTPSFLRDTQSDYDKMVRQMPDLYKLQYQFSDTPIPTAVMDSAFVVMLVGVIGDILKRFQPHVVVTTHPMFMAPLDAYITIRRLNIPFLTVVTDLTNVHRMWFNQGADLILVPTPEAGDQVVASGCSPERVRVTGIPVNPAIVREMRSPAEIRASLGWSLELTTLLVVGSKRVKNLMSFLHVLDHSALPVQFILVAGGDDQLYSQFQAADWHAQAHTYNFVDSLPEFMRAADLVISKAGGLITSETLACGLPMLIVDVTPGQELGNAAYVVNNGAGELADDPIEALEILFHWLSDDRRLLSERARASAALGRPQSAYITAELAFLAAERGRALPSSRLIEWRPKFRELLHKFDLSVDDK